VLVLGASGSGKSSLLRAGVLPLLVRPGVIDGIGVWRRAVLKPSETVGDLFDALARALLSITALPEIAADGTQQDSLAAMLRANPEGVPLLIKEVLSRAAREVQINERLTRQPTSRFALGLDQLEEMFTLQDRFAADQRRAFFRSIGALAASGYVWIVATLRSDFYHRCEEIPELVELKKGLGQYHLLSPNRAELSQMIRLPAAAAGIQFEDHPEKGRLDNRIRDDAVASPQVLPLLEFALEELYKLGHANGILEHDEYDKLGGVAGALAKRAEGLFLTLPPNAQSALDQVLRQLISLGGEKDLPIARSASIGTFASRGPSELVAAFVSARLFQADQNYNGENIIRIVHEALFSAWPRLNRWIEDNRAFLEARRQLEVDLERWKKHQRKKGYLLPQGERLKAARYIFRTYRHDLSRDECDYIRRSNGNVRLSSWRLRLILILLLTGAAAFPLLLVYIAFVSGVNFGAYGPVMGHYFQGKLFDLRNMKHRALDEYQLGLSATPQIKMPLSWRWFDIWVFDRTMQIKTEIGGSVPEEATIKEFLDWGAEDVKNSMGEDDQSRFLINLNWHIGGLMFNQRRWPEAYKYYAETASVAKQQLERNPANAQARDDLIDGLRECGRVRFNEGKLPAAIDLFSEVLQLLEANAPSVAGKVEMDYLEAIAFIHFYLGRAFQSAGDHKASVRGAFC
jgi:hypothetical protein